MSKSPSPRNVSAPKMGGGGSRPPALPGSAPSGGASRMPHVGGHTTNTGNGRQGC